MGPCALRVAGWALLASLFARAAFAQSDAEQTDPLHDAAAPRSAQQQPSSTKPATDDDLEVSATLAPLPVDTAASNPVSAQAAPSSVVEFGGRGQWVMMGSSNGFDISNAAFSNSAASNLHIGAGLGLDHFVVDNVSVGFDAEASYHDGKGYGVSTLNQTVSREFAGGIRLGANAPLTESISWYPRLTLMLASSHQTSKQLSSSNGEPLSPTVSSSSIGPAVNLYAPLLLHPAAHFVVGFGPRLQHDFGVIRGGPYDGSQSTWLSGEFVVGGWWGGTTPEVRERGDASDGAKPEKTAEQAFGEPGQLVLTTSTNAWIGHHSYANSKGSSTELVIAPSVDYFVGNGTSMGAEIDIGYSSGSGFDAWGTPTESSSTSFGGALRAGYDVRLSSKASIWLLVGAGYGSVASDISSEKGSNQHTWTRGWIDASAPVLLHPASHFFVGVGPFLFHEFDSRDQYDLEINATRLGVSLILGGWFGGPNKLAW